MDPLQKKINFLLQKKQKITQEVDLLLEKRNKELLDILKDVPSPSIDPSILTGGLLHVCEQAVANPQLANQWREKGLKFRRGKTSNTKPLPTAV